MGFVCRVAADSPVAVRTDTLFALFARGQPSAANAGRHGRRRDGGFDRAVASRSNPGLPFLLPVAQYAQGSGRRSLAHGGTAGRSGLHRGEVKLTIETGKKRRAVDAGFFPVLLLDKIKVLSNRREAKTGFSAFCLMAPINRPAWSKSINRAGRQYRLISDKINARLLYPFP